jgi:hypothetical protein
MLLTKEIMIFKKMIKIEDLSINSHKKIEVKCDNCGNEKYVKYQSYNKSTNNNTEKFYCNNKECINKKRKIAIQKKYDVDNVFQIDVVKDKIKDTNIGKYGVENPQQNNKIKQKTEKTNLKRYGVKNPFQSDIIKDKIKKTNLKKHGVEYPSQSHIIRSKMCITNLMNYGFDYPSQNKDFFNKNLKNGFKLTYVDELSRQGGYELDFVLKYKDKIKIENGLSIEYYYLNDKKIYHSDFYLPDYYLVVEIKSCYWYDVHKEQCKAKEEYSKKIHNYIMILDKDYSEFEKIIKI